MTRIAFVANAFNARIRMYSRNLFSPGFAFQRNAVFLRFRTGVLLNMIHSIREALNYFGKLMVPPGLFSRSIY